MTGRKMMMMMMKGFIYRTAAAVKELGERRRMAWLLRLGLWIRGLVMGRSDKK
jgi:hypothetical protein